MKNQDVFTDLRLNRGNDIMFAFDNALTYTNFLTDNMDEINGKKKQNKKIEGYNQISNPIERNLLYDIDQMFNPTQNNEQFPFMNMNMNSNLKTNERKNEKMKMPNIRLVQGGQSIISYNMKTNKKQKAGNHYPFKFKTIRNKL